MTEVALTPRYTLRLAARGCPTVNLPVTDSEMASAAFQRYRDTYGFGASEMRKGCGDVRDATGSLVAHISYNGRAWDGEALVHDAVCES